MANTTQICFRIDEEVKQNAEKALDDMGLTMSAAITVFLNKVGREHRIPFEINAQNSIVLLGDHLLANKSNFSNMVTIFEKDCREYGTNFTESADTYKKRFSG